jgi:hypothetical protein
MGYTELQPDNSACNREFYTTFPHELIEKLTARTIVLDKNSMLFEQKLENVTEGLTGEYHNLLNKLSIEDVLILVDYIISLKTEINPSDNYRKSVIKIVGKFMIFCRLSTDKPLVQLGREDVLAFLDSFRKSDSSAPTSA